MENLTFRGGPGTDHHCFPFGIVQLDRRTSPPPVATRRYRRAVRSAHYQWTVGASAVSTLASSYSPWPRRIPALEAHGLVGPNGVNQSSPSRGDRPDAASMSRQAV